MTTFNRYVNNGILKALSRPQYDWSCSLTALTGVVNYLWSNKPVTQENLARALGLDAEAVGRFGGPGNETVMDWFLKYSKKMKFGGNCSVKIDWEDVEDFKDNDVAFGDIIKIIPQKNKVLMYHSYNHYNLLCGYFESAIDPTEAYSRTQVRRRRWLIQAEHRPDEPPLIPVRWRDVRRRLMAHERYCLVLFERTDA